MSAHTPSPPEPSGPTVEFSIVVPAYNSASTLAETLSSISSQTWSAWEAIVVDDGSTDDTARIAREFAASDDRFSVVCQGNAGLSSARNEGLRRASGRFFCPLDADDVYLPEFLESQEHFINKYPGFDVYSCNVDAWMPDGSRFRFPLRPEYQDVVETRFEDFLEQNQFTVITVIQRDALYRARGFRPMRCLEDYDLWLRLAVSGSRFLHNPDTLALYRQRPGSMSTDRDAMFHARCESLQFLLDSVELSLRRRAGVFAALARLRATPTRTRLERQLEARDYRGVRSLFWASRLTYRGTAKRVVALLVVTASPRLFATMTKLYGAFTRRASGSAETVSWSGRAETDDHGESRFNAARGGTAT